MKFRKVDGIMTGKIANVPVLALLLDIRMSQQKAGKLIACLEALEQEYNSELDKLEDFKVEIIQKYGNKKEKKKNVLNVTNPNYKLAQEEISKYYEELGEKEMSVIIDIDFEDVQVSPLQKRALDLLVNVD